MALAAAGGIVVVRSPRPARGLPTGAATGDLELKAAGPPPGLGAGGAFRFPIPKNGGSGMAGAILSRALLLLVLWLPVSTRLAAVAGVGAPGAGTMGRMLWEIPPPLAIFFGNPWPGCCRCACAAIAAAPAECVATVVGTPVVISSTLCRFGGPCLIARSESLSSSPDDESVLTCFVSDRSPLLPDSGSLCSESPNIGSGSG